MDEKKTFQGKILSKTALFTATSLLMLTTAYAPKALAIGLANIQVDSYLNEPFEAEIPIEDMGKISVNEIKVRLAGQDKFQEVGMDYASYLGYLNFEAKETRSGRAIISITSEKPMNEPILNFLLEMRTSQGEYFREYTVFLDPPLYSNLSKPSKTVNDDTLNQNKDVRYYGPTTNEDHLWNIAAKYRPANANIEQTAVAIFEANDSAFIADNMNGLKSHQRLVIPSSKEILQISKEDAALVIVKQNKSWAARSAQTESDNETGDQTNNQTTDGQYTEKAIPNVNGSADSQSSAVSMPAMSAATNPNGAGAVSNTSGDQNMQEVKTELAYVMQTLTSLRDSNTTLTNQLQQVEQQNTELTKELQKKDEMILNLEQLAGSKKKTPGSTTSSAATTETHVEGDGSSSFVQSTWLALPLLTLLGLLGYWFYKKRYQVSESESEEQKVDPRFMEVAQQQVAEPKAPQPVTQPEVKENKPVESVQPADVVTPVKKENIPPPAEKVLDKTPPTPAPSPDVIQEEDLTDWYEDESEEEINLETPETLPETELKKTETTEPVKNEEVPRVMEFEPGLGSGLKPELTKKEENVSESKEDTEPTSPLTLEQDIPVVLKEEHAEEHDTSDKLDTIDTKLDLARTYLTMEEYSAALKLLDTVIHSDKIKKSQKDKAMALAEKAREGEKKNGEI